jgi:hypothetical protein
MIAMLVVVSATMVASAVPAMIWQNGQFGTVFLLGLGCLAPACPIRATLVNP